MKTSQEIIERLRGRAKIRRAIPRVTDGADRISDECEVAADKIEQLEADLAHWKANHADMVRRCAIYSQRPDLPVDRIPAADAYQVVIDRQAAEIREKELKWESATKELCQRAFERGVAQTTQRLSAIPAGEVAEWVVRLRDFKRELGVDDDEHLADILIRLQREKEVLERKIKNYEPTNLYNGLTIN